MFQFNRRQTAIAIAGMAALPLLRLRSALAQNQIGDDTLEIGKEAYVYGFPMVDLYRILWGQFANVGGPAYRGGINTVFSNGNVATPADTLTQTTNSDTPYSRALLDLRAEPMVVTLPAIEARRYYVVQIADLYTYNSGYLGTRATGNAGGNFLIVGPGWNKAVPKGIKKVVKADTDLMYLNFRTQLFEPTDIDAVRAIQAKYKITPLSGYIGSSTPEPSRSIQWIKPLTPSQERSSLDFFNVLAWVLQYCPPYPDEVPLLAKFRTIGISPGTSFHPSALSAAAQQGLRTGMQQGQSEIHTAEAALTSSAALFGSREQLGTNYLNRAVAAQVGIMGNTAAEAMYLAYAHDADKHKLDGASSYILRFTAGQLPPVNAFWSITMYGAPDQMLVKNPIHRYLINSAMLPSLKKDGDGGYTIYVQHESPGSEKDSNWLPASAGPFFMIMRCYYPKEAIINGSWKQPPLEKVG